MAGKEERSSDGAEVAPGASVGLLDQEPWVDAACFFFQAEDGIRDVAVTGVQTCALPIFIIWNPDGTFNSFGPGMEWLTGFTEWLAVQDGFGNPTQNIVTADGPLFIHSVRDIDRKSVV